MFSMTTAAELRQRAEQTQKKQDDKPGTDGAGTTLHEQKVEKVIGMHGKGETTGHVGGEERFLAEEKEELPGGTVGNGDGNGVVVGGHNEEDEDFVMSDEQVNDFFKITTQRLASHEEREAIKAKVTPERRIPALLLDVQNDQLEAMGIQKVAGKAALNRYARTTAMRDKEAHERMDAFTQSCQRTYIELLREMEPKEVETEAKMTPAQITEFFEACDTLMALSETKEQLRTEYLETEKAPDGTIISMQRKMLRTMGIEPDHGVSCLNTFAKEYPEDAKLQKRLQEFMRCASMARQEAMLGKEEMTKRMQMQQVTMMKQQKMAMELQELDAAGREELTKRVEEMQMKHAVAIQTLSTPEERQAYVRGIPEEEQWEIAKLQMLRMQAMASSNGGHSHDHAHLEHHHGHDHAHGQHPSHSSEPEGSASHNPSQESSSS